MPLQDQQQLSQLSQPGGPQPQARPSPQPSAAPSPQPGLPQNGSPLPSGSPSPTPEADPFGGAIEALASDAGPGQTLDTAIQALEQRLMSQPLPGTQPVVSPDEIQQLREATPPGTSVDDEVSPVVEESPGVFGKVMGRLFGTDVDDPLPWTRMGTTIAGGLGVGLTAASRMPGPPIAKGVAGVAGSVAGTVLGAAAPETTMELLESMGWLPEGTRDRLGLNSEQLATVLEGEALLDLATLGGVSAVRLTGRGITGLLTGANAGSRRLAEEATREGIALLPVQVGEGRLARGFVSVMGRFPWVAGGLKGKAERAMGQIAESFNGIPARLGPLASMDQVSQSILRDAEATAGAISQHYTEQFTQLLSRADMQGIVVRPTNTRRVTEEITRNISRSTPQGMDGVPLAVPKNTRDLRTFINRTTRLLYEGTEVADQSLRRMDTVLQSIDEQIVKYADGGDVGAIQRLERLRNAVSADMLTSHFTRSGSSTPATRELVGEFRRLDDELTFAVNQLFQSATARRMGAVSSPTMRSARFTELGTRGMDSLAKVVLRGDSPQVVDELANLVTPETMRQLTGSVLNEAIQGAMIREGDVMRFDVDTFSRAIGMNDRTSGKFLQTQRLLQASGGVTMDQLDTLVEVARRASGAEIPDVSSFVARRATLGGIKSAINTIRPWAIVGAAGATTPAYLGSILAIGGSRLLASMISDPRSARSLRAVLQPETRRAIKGSAWVRGVTYGADNLAQHGVITAEEADNLANNARTWAIELDKALRLEQNP